MLLRESVRRRLLHPGANTHQIIDVYIATIKVLRILDPKVKRFVCGDKLPQFAAMSSRPAAAEPRHSAPHTPPRDVIMATADCIPQTPSFQHGVRGAYPCAWSAPSRCVYKFQSSTRYQARGAAIGNIVATTTAAPLPPAWGW